MGLSKQQPRLTRLAWRDYRPDVTEYHDCINLIESHMKMLSAAELEEMNPKHRQAGAPCLKNEDFKKTQYSRRKLDLPPWTLKNLDISKPPVPLSAGSGTANTPRN